MGNRKELSQNMQRLGISNTRSVVVGLALLVASMFLWAAFAPGTASAQLPDICEQYDDPEICIGAIDEADEDDGGNTGPDGNGFDPDGDGNGDGNGDRDGSGDADGELPFTGYPLTALILLLLVLLAIGLTIRSGTALRDKLARRH